ncbi:hypothetical protein C8R43DRAFT_45831 [Mycena crocata]|nr:hypothetical protein C8R43DRAFT_45831 [Mycena crocata]
MHESLHPRNLTRIKAQSLKELAELSAASSLKELKCILSFIHRLPAGEALLILPVLFINLDITRIPSPSQLDTNSNSQYVDLAFLSTTILSILAKLKTFPVGASPDLWPRVSKWLFFFDTYWECLPGVPFVQKIKTSLLHIRLILTLGEHPDTLAVIRQARGVRRILAVAWKAMVHNNTDFETHGSYQVVVRILDILTDEKGEQENFEEILDGVGGFDALAAILIAQLSRASSQPRVTPERFVVSCITFFRDESASSHHVRSALCRRQIVPVLLTTLSSLHAIASNDLVTECFVCLGDVLTWHPGYPLIHQALTAGLLELIILFASPATELTHLLSRTISELLEVTLPASLVHYCILSQLATSFPRIAKLAVEKEMRKSVFSGAWDAFSVLVKARIEVLDLWERDNRPSHKACDYMNCGKIDVRRNFKCCGGCRGADYCSTRCQSADWRDGHRNVCKQLGASRLEWDDGLMTRGKAFLRHLLHYDYATCIFEVWATQIWFMYRYPGEAFFTSFTYTSAGEVVIDTGPASLISETEEGKALHLPVLARAAQSKGRMETHVMIILDGKKERYLLFPMRMDSSKLSNALRHVAQRLPSGLTSEELPSRINPDLDTIFADLRLRPINLLH